MAHKTRKLVGVILMLSLLVAALTAFTITASAADTTVTFELGANGSASHYDGSSKTEYTETVGGYTLDITNGTNMYTGARDAKGNSCIKLGTSSKAGSFSFTVPNDVTAVVIKVAAYKAKTASVTINNVKTTLTNKSDNGTYDEITVDTTSTKTVSFAVSSGYRAMVNSIVFNAQTGGCAHANTSETITVPATCTTAGTKTITCNDCDDYEITEPIAALGHEGGEATCSELAVCTRCGEGYGKLDPHNFVNGTCTACGEELPSEATVSFANTDHRTEFSAEKQVWQNMGLVITNNKGDSSNNIADYSNPVRFYKSSQIVISFPGMTQIVVNANTTAYATALVNSVGNAATADGKVVTITLSETADSFSIVLGDQVRVDSITVTAAKQSEPACEHEYTYVCDKICNKCNELTREDANHTITHVEAKAATCYEDGNIEYWYCTDCNYAWLDEDCTLNTNLKAVILPATHTYNTFNKVVVVDNVPYAVYACECGETDNRSIFTFRGASIRYKDGATSDQLAIRFGYQFDPNVIDYLVSWSWDYKAIDGNAVVSGTQAGSAITEAGVSNLVFTNIPTKRIDGTFEVTLTLVIEIDGVQYTYTEEEANKRVISNVLTDIAKDEKETQEARDYANLVLAAFAQLPDDDEANFPANKEEGN